MEISLFSRTWQHDTYQSPKELRSSGVAPRGLKKYRGTLTKIFTAENDREVRLALKACKESNFRLMQVKCYIDDDNDLVIASEFCYNNDEYFEPQLNIALQGVVTAKKQFVAKYDEIESEDRLIQEINDQE